MIFSSRRPFFDVVVEMSKSLKFKDYLTDLCQLVTRYYYKENPVQGMSDQLENDQL